MIKVEKYLIYNHYLNEQLNYLFLYQYNSRGYQKDWSNLGGFGG